MSEQQRFQGGGMDSYQPPADWIQIKLPGQRHMTITEFLEARIAEDENNAKRAAFGWGAEWDSVPDNEDEWSFINTEGKKEMVGSEDADVIIHIAQHDPARVLAECAAKRAIMSRHVSCDDVSYGDASTCPEIRTLAAVYSDHPDYDPAWALTDS